MLRSDKLRLNARPRNAFSRLTAHRSLHQPLPNSLRMRVELIPTLIILFFKIITINQDKFSNAY